MKINPYNVIPKTLKFDSSEMKYPPRAAIYTPVRDDYNEAGFKSLMLQFKKCTKFVEKMGFTLIRVYDDNKRLAKAGYSGLNEMIQAGHNNEFDYIVCTSFDKLPKNLPLFLSKLEIGAFTPEIIPLDCYQVKSKRIATAELLPKYRRLNKL